MSRDALSAVFVAVPIAVLAAVLVTLAMRQEEPPPAGQVTTEDLRALESRLADRIERSVAASTGPEVADLGGGRGTPSARAGEVEQGTEPQDRGPTEAGTAAADAPTRDGPEVAPGKRAEKARSILAKLATGSLNPDELSELWDSLPGSGVEDEAIAAFTKRSKAHPNEPDAHYGLGVALTSKLLTTKSYVDQATLGSRALGAFAKTLELDDDHFGARFSTAISYTYWPPAMGKGPEAIKHFEILRQRHGSDKSSDEMRMVYLSLGNEYLKMGNKDKAREAFRDGVSVFPDSKEIRSALEAMD